MSCSLEFSISFFNSDLIQVGVLDGGGGGCVWIPLDIKIIKGNLFKSKGVSILNSTEQAIRCNFIF
jgi:hypothetical protein